MIKNRYVDIRPKLKLNNFTNNCSICKLFNNMKQYIPYMLQPNQACISTYKVWIPYEIGLNLPSTECRLR